jgi:signal transduction histidine kinase
VLNSVNVSSSLISDRIKTSKISNVGRVAALLQEHADNLGEFMSSDPKGTRIPAFLDDLAKHLSREQAITLKELEGLNKNIEHIKDIVSMQQSYAKVAGVTQTLNVLELVEDALRMNESALLRHDVKLIRDYDRVLPQITVDKHKVMQILINLVRNAKYACDESGLHDKRLTVRIKSTEERVFISVIDNGVGIPQENLTRIFIHGFTTRKTGHGFGLHSGALAAKELGGTLLVHSDGPGTGATFTLDLPKAPSQNN